MNTENWDRHVQTMCFGQEYRGMTVPRMDIIEAEVKQEGTDVLLMCPECDRRFWSHITREGGGTNTVVRDESICAQCPGCGAEWDGKEHRFYSIGVMIDSRIDVLHSVEADDPGAALRLAMECKLPGEWEGILGIQIEEITRDEHARLQVGVRIAGEMIAIPREEHVFGDMFGNLSESNRADN